jgi:signal transduction histidine kinase
MTELFSERCAVACVVSLPEGELNLTPAQSITLYRLCQEALTNVMKYAKAKRVRITLTNDGAQWTLVIADDGIGIDANTTQPNRRFAHGLLGMRERVVALGGHFDINGSTGIGTTLTATFPIAAIGEAEV